MKQLEKLTFPLLIAAAVIGIWMAFRNPNQPTQSNQPSASGAGLPNYLPQAQTYQVNPPQLSAPTQAQLLADPYNPFPGQAPMKTPPPYISFNLGPGHDLSKIPLTPTQIQQLGGDRSNGGACGSCNSCSTNQCDGTSYPDGPGNATFARNAPQLIGRITKQDPGWLNRAAYNFLGSDSIDNPTIPAAPGNGIVNSQQPIATNDVLPQARHPHDPWVSQQNPVAVTPAVLAPPKLMHATDQWQGGAQRPASVKIVQDTIATDFNVFGSQVPKLSARLLASLSRTPVN